MLFHKIRKKMGTFSNGNNMDYSQKNPSLGYHGNTLSYFIVNDRHVLRMARYRLYDIVLFSTP